MRFSGKVCYLAVSRQGQKHVLTFLKNKADAVAQWDTSTRVSPLFMISDHRVRSPESPSLSGKSYLLFLGPIHPEKVLSACSRNCEVWLTLGLLNVVVRCRNRQTIENIERAAARSAIAFERWTVDRKTIAALASQRSAPTPPAFAKRLARLCRTNQGDELREATAEYTPMMAATLARVAALLPSEAADLLKGADVVVEMLSDAARKQTAGSSYQKLSRILTINAGLGRYTAQTLTGVPPILYSPCHYWAHSLLGIGTANLALSQFRRFLQQIVGEARIPQRVAAFSQITSNIPDLLAAPIPELDYLYRDDLALDTADPIIPLLSFFSSRDGYRSTESTISVPLASVTACNSTRWSLLTLTHEVSHVIIRGILSEIYPDFDEENASLQAVYDTIRNRRNGTNLLQEIRRVVVASVLQIQTAETGQHQHHIDIDDLEQLLKKWRQEVDEILVHVFDFLYFYGRNDERYVKGIWMSWGTIPNIARRVRAYVVRTVCAVASAHVRRRGCLDFARSLVSKHLESLQTSGYGGKYTTLAIKMLSDDWDDDIEKAVRARLPLIKLVRYIFFSPTLATNLRGETHMSSDASQHEGYALRSAELELRPIRNPIHFLELYTRNGPPNPVQSAWFLYVLSFCVTDE